MGSTKYRTDASEKSIKKSSGRAPGRPKSMKNRARANRGQHMAAKRRPRAPKRRPRGTKEAPKSVQEPPQSVQEQPNSRPRGARGRPKAFQNRARGHLRRDFGMFFVISAFRKAPALRFGRFFRHVAMLREGSKGDFSAHTQCFMRFSPC